MKNKNIHLIPTKGTGSVYISTDVTPNLYSNWRGEGYHMYITSPNEDINENDYIITKDGRLVEVSYIMSKDIEGASKVVLTTDELYIHNAVVPKEYNPSPQYVQKIDNDFVMWFINNPSCEEVRVDKSILYKPYNDERDIPEFSHYEYKIVTPEEPTSCACGANISCKCEPEQSVEEYEQQGLEKHSYEFKQETLEEAAKKYIGFPLNKDMDEEQRYYNPNVKTYEAFIKGGEWEKSQGGYTKEDVRFIALKFFYYWWNEPGNNTEQGFDDWFKNFKKE